MPDTANANLFLYMEKATFLNDPTSLLPEQTFFKESRISFPKCL
jgi:hypothetical protein